MYTLVTVIKQIKCVRAFKIDIKMTNEVQNTKKINLFTGAAIFVFVCLTELGILLEL